VKAGLFALVAAGVSLAAAQPVAPGAHDPSTPVECDGTFWIFTTGHGVRTLSSRDLVNWTRGPAALSSVPAWVQREVPEYRARNGCWAPDVVRVGDRYRLYYSVSVFGKNTSAIGLAINRTLDPHSPAYRWQDAGPVVVSKAGDTFNAIDPAVFLDKDGRQWLAFGSFWSGIQLVELDPATGLRRKDAPLRTVAHKNEIEAAFLHRHGDFHYLFVNWGLCCRGVDSTYEIRVGRSRSVTGPYLDRDGRDMREGGGTPVLASEPPMIGPGHAGIVHANGREWFSFHYYDGLDDGRPKLGLRPLSWDDAGWPVVGAAEAPKK
jgi:arabinan endo-1,5-alpha-L-arabinosidase